MSSGKSPRHDEHGREILDPKPMALPVGFRRPESLDQKIARMLRVAQQHAQDEGLETLEESEDFDTGEQDLREYPFEHEQSRGERAFESAVQLEEDRREIARMEQERKNRGSWNKLKERFLKPRDRSKEGRFRTNEDDRGDGSRDAEPVE